METVQHSNAGSHRSGSSKDRLAAKMRSAELSLRLPGGAPSEDD